MVLLVPLISSSDSIALAFFWKSNNNSEVKVKVGILAIIGYRFDAVSEDGWTCISKPSGWQLTQGSFLLHLQIFFPLQLFPPLPQLFFKLFLNACVGLFYKYTRDTLKTRWQVLRRHVVDSLLCGSDASPAEATRFPAKLPRKIVPIKRKVRMYS